ncbi:MAG: helix-turn-helix transcriptional regulator [Bacteroidaceae bacterium]|nr:helix-turn-helix transcriptional regulator [Bacteroidaceae bacterium]
MSSEEMKRLHLTPVTDYIAEDYGEEGTPSRTGFDARMDAFILGERLKEERLKAGFTQEQLAERIGTRKSYISRVENGHADIQVSTLFKIFNGLGRRLRLTVL